MVQETQVEDYSEPATQNPNLEAGTNNAEELQEHPSHEVVTPSTSKGKVIAIKTKRVSQITTPQLLSKRQRKPENTIDHAIHTLQNIANDCKEPEDNEFDIFCKSLAYQLKNMPLDRALVCQENLQSVMTKERLNQITLSAPLQRGSNSACSTQVQSLQSRNSSACSMAQLDYFEEPSSVQSSQYENDQSPLYQSPPYYENEQPQEPSSEQSSQYENEQSSSYQSPPYENEQPPSYQQQPHEQCSDLLNKAVLSIL